MRLPNYSRQVLASLAAEIAETIEAEYRKRKRKKVSVHLRQDAETLSKLLPALQAARTNKDGSLPAGFFDEHRDITALVIRLVQQKFPARRDFDAIDEAKSVLRRIHSKVWLVDHMASLPPVRKEAKRGGSVSTKGMTVVQKRAHNAKANLDKWVTRLKLAKTKHAKYLRKVRYYQKKGVLK